MDEGECSSSTAFCREPAAIGPELVAKLDDLLQRHHDRLVQNLQERFQERLLVSGRGSMPMPRTAPSHQKVNHRSSGWSAASSAKFRSERSQSGETPALSKRVSFISELGGEAQRPSRGSSFATASELDEETESRASFESSFSQCEKAKRMQSLKYHAPPKLHRSGASRVGEALERARSVRHVVHEGLKRLVTSNVFEMIMSTVIISNALFCGVEVEYVAQSRQINPPHAFSVISMLYAVVFGLELLLRMVAEGWKFCWKPNWRWNLFDSLIVLISFLEVAVDMGDNASQVPSIRVIRMARVIRILRIARIMRYFRPLRILIHSVVNTMRSLMWTMVLLLVILYVFGILFTQATMQHILGADPDHIELLDESYGTVGRSVFTLFKAISGGVSWQEIVAPLWTLHPVWVAFYLVYFSFTYFAVLNVVTGVFCQTAIESAGHDQEMAAQAQIAAKQEYAKQLKNIFAQINKGKGDKITLRDLEESMQDNKEKLCAYFASIDISIDQAFSLFKLLDKDERHVLDINEFVTGCLKLRGAAKSVDIQMMMYETRWKLQRCYQAIKDMEGKVFFTHEMLAAHASGGSALDSATLGGTDWEMVDEDNRDSGPPVRHEII